MKRIVTAALVLPLLVACGARPAAPGPALAPAAAAGAALDQDTVVSRCLPQLTRAAEYDGSEVQVEPLSTDTVMPVKPLLSLHAGDLVAFYGRSEGVEDPGRIAWARLDTMCKVPATDPSGAPGSAPLPAAETRPAQDQPARDLQLCTQAPDVTGFFTDPAYVETQVVVPDVRDHRLGSEAWAPDGDATGGVVGVQVLADPSDARAAVCSFGLYGGPLVQRVPVTTKLTPFSYDNGPKGGRDRYVAVGVVPSVGDAQKQPARTIEVTPPGRATQTFPVRKTGLAGDGGVGSYAFIMRFTAVTSPIGAKHTRVRLLDKSGRALWSGQWDVGLPGR